MIAKILKIKLLFTGWDSVVVIVVVVAVVFMDDDDDDDDDSGSKTASVWNHDVMTYFCDMTSSSHLSYIKSRFTDRL